MRRRLLSAVGLLLFAGLARAQTLGPVDWIFLVDTSMSMRGAGGTKDVFADVQASIDTFVREANDGDTVAIYTFDQDVRMHSAMPIGGTARADLQKIVQGLEAGGKRTHLGAAIAAGLERASSLPKDEKRTRAVVLFTDGKEDVKGIENPTPIDASLSRVGDTYVYFVSMGEHEPQLDAFAAKAKRASVLMAPTPEAIRTIAQQIRRTIPPPPKTVPQQPSQPATRRREAPPQPERNYLSLIPLALLLLATALLLHHQRRRHNRLEGELEILRPATAPGAAFVGLPKLQASEVALSAILPIDLGGRDARLFVRRRGAKKKVWISATGGTLRINDVETPLGELFDADTIELGDAKLRFNRVGDERQEDSL